MILKCLLCEERGKCHIVVRVPARHLRIFDLVFSTEKTEALAIYCLYIHVFQRKHHFQLIMSLTNKEFSITNDSVNSYF